MDFGLNGSFALDNNLYWNSLSSNQLLTDLENDSFYKFAENNTKSHTKTKYSTMVVSTLVMVILAILLPPVPVAIKVRLKRRFNSIMFCC